jgi:hypothetical protein
MRSSHRLFKTTRSRSEERSAFRANSARGSCRDHDAGALERIVVVAARKLSWSSSARHRCPCSRSQEMGTTGPDTPPREDLSPGAAMAWVIRFSCTFGFARKRGGFPFPPVAMSTGGVLWQPLTKDRGVANFCTLAPRHSCKTYYSYGSRAGGPYAFQFALLHRWSQKDRGIIGIGGSRSNPWDAVSAGQKVASSGGGTWPVCMCETWSVQCKE